MHDKKCGIGLSSDEADPERPKVEECGDAIGSSMLHRHRCYMDSTPSISAANAAAVDEAEDSLTPEDVPPLARTLSSLRVQPDLSVRSAGQTTRLKFALCDVNVMIACLGNKLTWDTRRL
jgi:hypothetical protein